MKLSLATVLGEPYEHSYGAEVRYNCIYCEQHGKSADINYHLYVNQESGLFFCHRCEMRGHISKFDDAIVDTHYTLSRVEMLVNSFKPGADTKIEPMATAGLPDDYFAIEDLPNSKAMDYLEDRGIPFELAVTRGLGFGTKRNKGRIIFPVFNYEHTDCVYWVARSYTNLDHQADCECFLCKAKYKNAPKAKRRYFLYGAEFVEGDTCCLTEGAISSLCAGEGGVAGFGKYITSQQLDILSERFDRIQVALDPDAIKNAIDVMKELMARRKHVEFIPLPDDKDPADIGIEGMTYIRKNEAIPISRANLGTVLL